MVLPVQRFVGLDGNADAELQFALESRAGAVRWVFPPALRRALESSPSLDAPLDGLPVGVFMRAEVDRIGDPLFGVLVRLGALTGAQVALIPVELRYGPPGPDASAGTARIAAAIVDVRTGYVLWFGIEEGAPGGPSDPGVMASAVDALARRLAGRSGR